MRTGKGRFTTSEVQTVIKDGLQGDFSQGEIKVFDFTYGIEASVNVSMSMSYQEDIPVYNILIIDAFICQEGHFHAMNLAEMTLLRQQGFKPETFRNFVAHICADVVTTFLLGANDIERH